MAASRGGLGASPPEIGQAPSLKLYITTYEQNFFLLIHMYVVSKSAEFYAA